MKGHCREEEGGGWEDTGAQSSKRPRDWANNAQARQQGPVRAGSSEERGITRSAEETSDFPHHPE